MIEKSSQLKTNRRSERDVEGQCIQTSFLNIKVDEDQDNMDASPLLRDSQESQKDHELVHTIYRTQGTTPLDGADIDGRSTRTFAVSYTMQ